MKSIVLIETRRRAVMGTRLSACAPVSPYALAHLAAAPAVRVRGVVVDTVAPTALAAAKAGNAVQVPGAAFAPQGVRPRGAPV